MRLPTLLLVCALCNSLAVPSSSGQLVQVRQDFSRDPGWDHYQNRIVGTEMPAVVQDFGWRRTGYTGGGRARSAGASRTRGVQAYYAMPLGQAPDLRRRALRLGQAGPAPHRAPRRRLRRLLQLPAAHLAGLELDGVPRLGGGRPGPGDVRLDVEPTGRPAGRRPPSCCRPDAKVHTWSFRYEPEAQGRSRPGTTRPSSGTSPIAPGTASRTSSRGRSTCSSG